jgi:hypothetical protein
VLSLRALTVLPSATILSANSFSEADKLRPSSIISLPVCFIVCSTSSLTTFSTVSSTISFLAVFSKTSIIAFSSVFIKAFAPSPTTGTAPITVAPNFIQLPFSPSATHFPSAIYL